jgi:hypothetical protein
MGISFHADARRRLQMHAWALPCREKQLHFLVLKRNVHAAVRHGAICLGQTMVCARYIMTVFGMLSR